MVYMKTYLHISFKCFFTIFLRIELDHIYKESWRRTLVLCFSWFSFLMVKKVLWQIHNRNPASRPSHKQMELGCLCCLSGNIPVNLATLGCRLTPNCGLFFNVNPHSEFPLLLCVEQHSGSNQAVMRSCDTGKYYKVPHAALPDTGRGSKKGSAILQVNKQRCTCQMDL